MTLFILLPSIVGCQFQVKLYLILEIMLWIFLCSTTTGVSGQSMKSHLCYFLNYKPSTRIPISAVFSYPSLKKIIILDYYSMFYELNSTSIHWSLSSANKTINLNTAVSGTIQSRWPSLSTNSSYDFTDEIIIDKEPYFCFHNKDKTGKCFHVDKPRSMLDWKEDMLKSSPAAEFNAKFFHQLAPCQQRSSISPTGGFILTFVENSHAAKSNHSSVLDCNFKWKLQPDDPPFQVFVYDGTVVIVNTKYAYLFAEAQVTTGGIANVIRVPLNELFVCGSLVAPLERLSFSTIILLTVGVIFCLVLLAEVAYLFGAFELCFHTKIPKSKRILRTPRVKRRRKSAKPKTPKPKTLSIDPTLTFPMLSPSDSGVGGNEDDQTITTDSTATEGGTEYVDGYGQSYNNRFQNGGYALGQPVQNYVPGNSAQQQTQHAPVTAYPASPYDGFNQNANYTGYQGQVSPYPLGYGQPLPQLVTQPLGNYPYNDCKSIKTNPSPNSHYTDNRQ